MRYFFLSYGFIYLMLLFYFLHKTFNIFKQKLAIRICGYLFCITMIMLPFIHAWIILPPLPGITGWIRLGFMFFCFMFMFIGILCDAVTWIFPKFKAYKLFTAYILVICSFIYGTYEAHSLKLTTINLNSSKLSKNEKIKIAFISDLHIGSMSSDKLIRKTIDMIISANPDILICGGDIIDDEPQDILKLKQWFSAIKTPLGKYCVLGNHESYFGKNKSSNIIKSLGLTLLKNDSLKIKNNIMLTGIDYSRSTDSKKELSLLKTFTENNYNILLKHVPTPPDTFCEQTDLMLSGHTHKGQIFPFNFFVRMIHKYMYGLYSLDENSYIYVSSGSGYWEIPLRIMARPEVVIINVSAA